MSKRPVNIGSGGNAKLRAKILQLEDDKESILRELGNTSNLFFRAYCAAMEIAEDEFEGPLSGDPIQDIKDHINALRHPRLRKCDDEDEAW